MIPERISYWQVFRLIFVIFSLYLLRDAFYRWDGFRYHSTFIEFLPSVALITILWSIVAVLAAILLWLQIVAFGQLSRFMGWKIKAKHLLMFTYTFILLIVMAQAGKKLILHETPTSFTLKFIVLLCVITTAIFLTWLLSNKSERLVSTIEERITPLVWLFGIWVIFSVPLVSYHTWVKQTDKIVSQRILQPPTADKNWPNIILVTFDALTARNMSVYGYNRPTTPFISKWAKEASLFTRLQAEGTITTPTIASLMTGKRLWTHQTYHVVGSSKPVRSNIESLPLMLKKNGYYNMAFVVNPVASVKTLGVSNSFEIAPLASEFWIPTTYRGVVDITLYRLFGDNIELYNWFIDYEFIFGKLIHLVFRGISKKVPPEEAFNRFLEVINDNPPEPFFAWIHVYPPHDPYRPPEPYKGMFDESQGLKRNKKESKEKSKYFSVLRARYDEFIRYCDEQFKDFITQLTTRNKLKNTIIILSADHGESFEHNYLGHSEPYLYEQVTHIPLIIREHDQSKGLIINDIVEQIDIPPTILDLANIPVPSWMEGRSLVPLMRGKKFSSRPAFSMNLENNLGRGHQITVGIFAVWEGDYKLIHNLENNKSLLFNLKDDPGELNNLFDKESEVGQRLLTLIQDNLKKANERISSGE